MLYGPEGCAVVNFNKRSIHEGWSGKRLVNSSHGHAVAVNIQLAFISQLQVCKGYRTSGRFNAASAVR